MPMMSGSACGLMGASATCRLVPDLALYLQWCSAMSRLVRLLLVNGQANHTSQCCWCGYHFLVQESALSLCLKIILQTWVFFDMFDVTAGSNACMIRMAAFVVLYIHAALACSVTMIKRAGSHLMI